MTLNISDYSDTNLIEAVELYGNHTDALSKAIHNLCYNELSKRRRVAEDRLWRARMELQHAENEVRSVHGLPLVEVHGADGKLE